MGSLFRSEPMALCQLFLQTEAAYPCVAELGELGVVQFRDLNPNVSAFQRKFVSEVRRCEEMERKLRYLEKEIKKDDIFCYDMQETPKSPQPREIVDLEATFERLENELREVNTNEETLKRNFLELTELKHILQRTQMFFDEVTHIGLKDRFVEYHDSGHGSQDEQEPLVADPPQTPQPSASRSVSLEFIAGVILRRRLPAFERLLWRACRGNVFLKWAEIDQALEDPVSGDEVRKCVFMVFFQGDQLKLLVRRVCEGFRATLYPCPETPRDRREMLMGVLTRIEDLKTVLNQTRDHRFRVLVAAGKNLHIWLAKTQKIKAIYHTLNMFNLDVTRKCLIAECWCPLNEMERIQDGLKRGTEHGGSNVPSIIQQMNLKEDEVPPTFNRTNKISSGFQNIVDAYGVAGYREINPAPFTMITFPFLFAIMFGDFGHGTLMMLFALFLIVKEKMLAQKKLEGEIFNTFFNGRYIILLMGVFSMYTGIVYNDVFSKSLNIFGSAWKITDFEEKQAAQVPHYILDVNQSYHGLPYAFGMDPVRHVFIALIYKPYDFVKDHQIWSMADNKLLFLNSFKMKMAVIIGIAQMCFGVVLSYFNYSFFRRRLDIFCQFLPQIIFLTSIFVYLVCLIFFKWIYFSVHPRETSVGYYPGTHCAPSLLIGFINMFMMKRGNVGYSNTSVDATCYLNTFYWGQPYFETFLVLLAVCCVPWMLLAKPLILRYQHRRRYSRRGFIRLPVSVNDNDDEEQLISGSSENEQELFATDSKPFDFSDIFIHQAIHTIEFCLGCISHTASYLRLWALSLAHAQLTEVCWNMVMQMGLKFVSAKNVEFQMIGGFITYLAFMMFAVITIGVLIIMEGLSAFLHALRLHWVEFQSKFYAGDGYPFTPFSFKVILEQSQD